VSGQLESPHFYRSGDEVRAPDGAVGKVVEGWALYALVEWIDGIRQEIDQFDPRYIVIQRAETT
jgi:hypothetical protein